MTPHTISNWTFLGPKCSTLFPIIDGLAFTIHHYTAGSKELVGTQDENLSTKNLESIVSYHRVSNLGT